LSSLCLSKFRIHSTRDASLTRRVQAACRIFEYNKILKQALFSSASFAAHPLNPLDVAPRNFELRVRFFPFGVVRPKVAIGKKSGALKFD
jgi:hypothetical protein